MCVGIAKITTIVAEHWAGPTRTSNAAAALLSMVETRYRCVESATDKLGSSMAHVGLMHIVSQSTKESHSVGLLLVLLSRF